MAKKSRVPTVADGGSDRENIAEPTDSIGNDGVELGSAEGSGGADTFYSDPASLDQDGGGISDAPSRTGKKRGRKPGTKNKPRAGKASQATADISGILFTLHLFAAKALKDDILILTNEESETLSAAITRVTELYEIPLLSEKHMAWLNLAMVSGTIYGTRFMAMAMKPKKSNVVDMPFVVGSEHANNP